MDSWGSKGIQRGAPLAPPPPPAHPSPPMAPPGLPPALLTPHLLWTLPSSPLTSDCPQLHSGRQCRHPRPPLPPLLLLLLIQDGVQRVVVEHVGGVLVGELEGGGGRSEGGREGGGSEGQGEGGRGGQ